MRIPVMVFVSLTAVGGSHRALASYECPNATKLTEQKMLSKVTHLLRKFSSANQVGSCSAEITVCNENLSGQPVPSTLMAEVLVTEKGGRQRFLPLYLPSGTDPKIFTEVSASENYLLFRWRDRYPDSQTGKFERFVLEVDAGDDGNKIQNLEVGYTTDLERSTRGNHRWTLCGERESLIEGDPGHRLYRSLRNWLLLWGEPQDLNQRR